MKGAPRSTKLFLKTLQSQPKPAGPFAKLASVFNHPVLTDSESRILLNEVNSSFRNALKESRHPDDIRPPPSIHNAYANKADNHIYQVVTDPRPASPPNISNLRNLLGSEALVDTNHSLQRHERSPITIFQNHLLQGTADIDLAVQCCKTYVLNQLKFKSDAESVNDGFRMYKMLRGNSLFLDRQNIPHAPLRGWLAAALLLSRQPSIPFQWLSQSLEVEDFESFRGLLSEVITSYGKIYNTAESPNEHIKFFVHILRARDRDYRLKVSDHPTTKASLHLGFKPLLDLNTSMRSLNKTPPPQLLEDMAQKLYRRSDDEGKRILAESIHLWDRQQSAFGVEVLIESGNLIGAADYLASFSPNKPSLEPWQHIVLGLLLARQLKRTREETGLLDQVMATVVGSLRRMIGRGEDAPTGLSLPENILSQWKQYTGRELDNDTYLTLELEYLEKMIRDSLA
ncbi:hypothetical protein TWF718_002225 [Orbilia javanica]|uniref:Uncharacterized protein n=1 Tax=Orbilia javanica TaxID=47235 RepID=A0AAN8RB92_9PEZI